MLLGAGRSSHVHRAGPVVGSSIKPLVAFAPESDSTAVPGMVAAVADADGVVVGAGAGAFELSSPHPARGAIAIVTRRNACFISLPRAGD